MGFKVNFLMGEISARVGFRLGALRGFTIRTAGMATLRCGQPARFKLESLILAQNERWRRALDMQVVRESHLRVASRAAHG